MCHFRSGRLFILLYESGFFPTQVALILDRSFIFSSLVARRVVYLIRSSIEELRVLVFSGFPEISHANPVFITLSRSYSYLSSSHYAKCSPGIPQNTLCSPMPTRDCRTFARTEKYAGRHVVAFLQFKFSRKVSFQSFKKTHQKTKLVLNVALALGHLGQSK